jgi:hypothetical protein
MLGRGWISRFARREVAMSRLVTEVLSDHKLRHSVFPVRHDLFYQRESGAIAPKWRHMRAIGTAGCVVSTLTTTAGL